MCECWFESIFNAHSRLAGISPISHSRELKFPPEEDVVRVVASWLTGSLACLPIYLPAGDDDDDDVHFHFHFTECFTSNSKSNTRAYTKFKLNTCTHSNAGATRQYLHAIIGLENVVYMCFKKIVSNQQKKILQSKIIASVHCSNSHVDKNFLCFQL